MSNLRAHLKKIHPKTIHEFDELIRKTQGISRKKSYFTKKIKNEECLENNLVKQPSEEKWEQFKTPKEQLRIAMPRWFSVLDLIITELKSHMTCKKTKASHCIGGYFICQKKSFTIFALQSECCNFNQLNYNRSCDF